MSSNKVERHRVVVIGAGGGGLCMGKRLREAGIEDFVILDKASGVGGTWWYNTYPGAECDVQSHLYSFSFEPKLDWSRPYAGQAEILGYFNHVADKYDLRRHIRFDTTITAARWRDADDRWQVTTADGRTYEAEVVVSAIGMFNNIVWPQIDGISDFKGDYWHSARWNHDIDLAGKRVGVVGIAASAIQFVPQIATKVGSLHLYQRTANWVVPKGNEPYTQAQIDYYRAHPEAVQKSRDDLYNVWNSLCTFQEKDLMRKIEESGLARIAEVNDPETRAKLTPHHPFGCRRPLFADNYYPVFNRDNVTLDTTDIERITSTGVRTVDGVETAFDVLIYSTGFETTTYLNAIEVSGRGGVTLNEAWRDGAMAYRGVTTSGFPNLYMLYGPNTNQGCILYMIEQEVDYVMRQLGRMDAEKLAWLDVTRQAMVAYNDELQKTMSTIDVWQASCGGEFYYRSSTGRLVTQFPGTMDDFTHVTHRTDTDAYEVKSRAA